VLYPRNVEIAHNDIYITPLLHINGGDMPCGENALDFKGGRDVHIPHNVI